MLTENQIKAATLLGIVMKLEEHDRELVFKCREKIQATLKPYPKPVSKLAVSWLLVDLVAEEESGV